MDEIKLRYFINVAQRKNFAQAAMDQHVVPSTISRQIAALEEEFGTPLFTRTTHRVDLTEAGARLYEQAHGYLAQFDSINENVRNLLTRAEHRVQIASGPYEAPLIIKAGKLYRKQDPNLEFHILRGRYYDYAQRMRAGTVNLLFTLRPAVDLIPGCVYTSLGKYRWMAVADRDSEYWQLSPEQQALFHGQKLVKSKDEDIDPAADYIATHKTEHLGFSLGGTFTMACVQASLGGVALLPEYIAPWLPPEMRMEQVFPEPLEVETVLAFNPESPNPHEHRFFEYIRENFHAADGGNS